MSLLSASENASYLKEIRAGGSLVGHDAGEIRLRHGTLHGIYERMSLKGSIASLSIWACWSGVMIEQSEHGLWPRRHDPGFGEVQRPLTPSLRVRRVIRGCAHRCRPSVAPCSARQGRGELLRKP
jgi:hypothetical protein